VTPFPILLSRPAVPEAEAAPGREEVETCIRDVHASPCPPLAHARFIWTMSLSRCVRCERLYSPGDEQDQCWYHPGQHRRLGWTCCRDPSQTAHGCRFGVHLEDESATAALDQLWLRPSEPLRRPHLCATDSTEASDVVVFQDPSGTMCVAQQPQLKTEDLASTPASGLKLLRPAMTTSVPINCKQDEAPADPSEQAGGEGGLHGSSVLVPYLVGPYDTFSAICMRHQMESEELQRLNGLKRRCVRPGSTLLVWAQRAAGEVREEMQRTQMLAFQRHCKCTAGEARYYLESNDYKVSASPCPHVDTQEVA